MFKGYVPKITLSGKETRKGDGFGIICNGESMCIDGFQGGEPTNGLIEWFNDNGVGTVDTAVLTHVHWDHYNGFLQMVESGRLKINLVLMYDPNTLKHGVDSSDNGRALQADINNAYKFIRRMQASGTKVRWIDKGGEVKCGDTTWRVYRDQPRGFCDDDQGEAYEFVNAGSLVLWSPETQLMLGGDGCADIKYAIAYFKALISGYDVSHHGGRCTQSNARAVADAGCVVAWETNIERDGAGKTDFTQFGARRLIQADVPVWMQNAPINIQAAGGKIVFQQGDKTISKAIPYKGDGMVDGWGKDDKGWFYIQNGKRQTGWHEDPWSQGINWFLFAPDGVMLTGWQFADWSGGKNYFLLDPKTGSMLTGWQYSAKDGKEGWYYLDPKTGAMKTGWVFVNGSWYYLDPETGVMQTGWLKWDGKWCYLEPDPDPKKNQGHCYVDCTAVIDGKTYRFDKDGYATEISTATPTIDRSKKFIDVSEFQNDIDWGKASKVVGAAYIRCGLRGSLAKTAPQDYKKIRFDKKWARNLAEVQKYGIPFSAYYFPTAINDAEALEGAKWFYEQVKDLNLAFPPALDSENVWGKNKEAGRANGLSRSERTRLLKIATDYFNERGMNIGIYASASWLNSKIDMSAFSQCVRDCTWVADSTGAVDYKGYYWLHQYGKGACAGFGGDVDLDRITGTIPSVRTDGKPQTTQPTEDPIDVMIRIMEAEVGTHEGPNNHTKYGDEMHAIQPSNMDKNAPWCDGWFDWCILKLCEHFGYGADMARMVLCGDFDDYTYNSVALYKKAGRWSQTPHRGDQIFFGGSGHTGGVVSVASGVEHTIEGNKGDEVRRCSYSTSSPSIIGYGRPKYYLLTGKITAADMPLIKKGSKGDTVKKLQEMLNDKGYKLTVDGDFGSKTDAAVRAYQKANHLEVDGEVGEKTWGSLFA